MNDEANGAEARIGDDLKFSKVWLVPIVALVIGIWMTYSYFAGQGPIVEVTFVSGEGIQAGTTKVKRKNVDVGEVLDLRLSDDAEKVVLSIRIYPHGETLLHKDSRFWVVRPRIGKGGVSGLNTLVSGAYIELSPGTDEDSTRSFEGLEKPPITPAGTPGLHVTLDSAGNRTLSEGDPIMFHGMPVGTIEYVFFNNEKRRTYYNAFIAAPYDRLVTEQTRFWFTSGLSFDLSADGIRLEIGTLLTLLGGGVSFDVPDGLPLGELITERAYFTIYENEGASREIRYDNAIPYMVLFDESVRGLRPGAPVEYRGVRVGEVVRTDIDYPGIGNLLEPESRIPVMIEIVPAQLGFEDDYSVLSDVEQRIDRLIAGGLRASLATGSLLTGQKYVELQHFDTTNAATDYFAGYTVIPSIDGNIGQLFANAGRTLDTINRLPLEQIAGSAQNAFDQAAATLAEFQKSATELERILADPASHDMVETLNETLVSFREMAIDFSEGSATNQDLQRSLESLRQTLLELEPVLRNLRRKPNSLIFGGGEDEDLQPRGVEE